MKKFHPIAIRRISEGLTQSDLARKCAWSQSQQGHFEAGYRYPTDKQLALISRFINTSLSQIRKEIDEWYNVREIKI